MRKASFAALAALGAAWITTAVASAPDSEAVEFYNAVTHHYFVTATASEALGIDAGAAGAGWMRTGRSFQVWLDKSAAPADAQPVCRFYSSGANSHFYTASTSECQSLQAQSAAERAATGHVSGWQLEGTAFFVQVPQGGSCPAGTVPLTRAYNNGFATGEGANHRFLDDAALQAAMVDDGWIAEGVVFCAAAKATGTEANQSATTTSFDAIAGTWNGPAKLEVETAAGETSTRDTLQLVIGSDGAVSGSVAGCAIAGTVATGDGFRSFFSGTATLTGCANAAFNGDHQRLRLQRFGSNTLVVQARQESTSGETTIAAALTDDGTTPGAPPAPATPPAADFSLVAGDWTGTVGFEAEGSGMHVESNLALALSISGTGAVSGTGAGCTFSGTLALPTKSSARFGGTITAAGCDNSAFNGDFTSVEVASDGNARLHVQLGRKGNGSEVQIEGSLQAAGSTSTPPVTPPVTASIVGSFHGTLGFTAGSASGTDSAALLTVATDGTVSGSAFGCTFSGQVNVAMKDDNGSTGSVTLAGCTNAALNGTFTQVQLHAEGANALEVEMQRAQKSGSDDNGSAAVEVHGTLQRTA